MRKYSCTVTHHLAVVVALNTLLCCFYFNDDVSCSIGAVGIGIQDSCRPTQVCVSVLHLFCFSVLFACWIITNQLYLNNSSQLNWHEPYDYSTCHLLRNVQ